MRPLTLVPALLAALLLPMMTASAMAARLIIDPAQGQLPGARALLVGAQHYRVDFVDGTCVALFDGCDSNADLGFRGNLARALAAAQALLDQVFLDTPHGAFDTDPMLTFGCNLPGQ